MAINQATILSIKQQLVKEETQQAIAAIVGNGYKCYAHKTTEQVFTADDISLEHQKSDTYAEYVPLDASFTFGFMQSFVQTVDDFEKQSELLEAISFESPFKNFKTKVYSLGLGDEWLAYRAICIIDVLKLA